MPGTGERRGSSERDEQAALTRYLDALAVRTQTAVSPRPAASARRRGRQRRIRRRIALGVAAAIVIVVTVLGVRSTDLGGTFRGGPATIEPLTPRQLPPELAPWKLTHTDTNYAELLGYPKPTYCEKGRRLAGVRHAQTFHYTSATSLTASFIEIVIRLDDQAEATRVARDLERWTADCPGTSRTDMPDPLRGSDPGASVSGWYQTEGQIATFTAIARRDSTIVVLLYRADVRWRPLLPSTLTYAALDRSGDAR
ncbi:hypothetical protein [Embleya hyalina]|nr:hypothetical protein [Embleya hyalina]